MVSPEFEATIIRVGSCGGLQHYINAGDFIVTERALRDGDTTRCYAGPEVEATADPDVCTALVEACRLLEYPYHVGLTCTTSDFYAHQERVAPGFPTLDPGKVERMCRKGILNFEMEMSVFLTLARVSSFNIRAGGGVRYSVSEPGGCSHRPSFSNSTRCAAYKQDYWQWSC